jgi:hypothetical protein
MYPTVYPTPPLTFGHNWDSFSVAFVTRVSYSKAIQSHIPPKSLSSNPYNSWQKDDGIYEVKVEIHLFVKPLPNEMGDIVFSISLLSFTITSGNEPSSCDFRTTSNIYRST